MKFEPIALSLMGAFTAALMVTAGFNPPSGETVSPRPAQSPMALQRAEPLPLPDGRSPRNDKITENQDPAPITGVAFDMPEFTVASGAAAIGGSARALSSAFVAMGYHFDKVITGEKAVPRLFLVSLPEDIAKVPENKKRKALFFRSVLPLVLQVNEEILADRKRLWKMRFRVRIGNKPGAADRLWLDVMTDRYKIKRQNRIADIDNLIARVDVIPPSLALAQAAEESGWGTSRYVREGNAIFGQWTFSAESSLVPKDRDAGKKHRVKAFATLTDSVRAYARNLNTHRAYRDFRKTRAAIRRQGAPLDGRLLAGRLTSYSERGAAYVASLRGLIDSNKLRRLDKARLDNDKDRPAI
ncbi:MAG TPA: hypothetical protein ENI69_03780 [Rhodospirillales bacterium]|nr:hypothetical protein [Rhodospirillales bacterium]